MSVTRTIFPTDRRRRAPGSQRAGSPVLGPVLEQKRSGDLVNGEEPLRLVTTAALCAVLGLVLWRWLERRDARIDLASFAVQGELNIPRGLWRLIVLVWVSGVLLILATGVLGYLGQLRMTPAEAALYLQDQLWRQTRREQARLNRWLALAEKRQDRREAGGANR